MDNYKEKRLKESLEKILAKLPLEIGRGDLKIVPIGEQNFTNQNYRIENGRQIFKVRVSEGNQDLIGIDREGELAILRAVAAMGIGPEVIAYIPPEGHLVTGFIEGRHLSLEDLRKPDNIRRIIEVLKQVHAIEGIEAAPPSFERIEMLISNARQENSMFPDDFAELLAGLQAAKAVLTKAQRKLCLCHNDLVSSNILEGNDSIYLIDWEYAGKADPMFDLASFSINQGLDREGDKVLLESYFGKVTEVELAEINLWKMVTIFLEAVWGILQAKISRFDKDYQGFANENWQVVRQYIQSKRFWEWLEIVSSS